MLVQEMIDIPGFVPDDYVEAFLAQEIVEQHEICDHDFVHAPNSLERVKVVLAAFAFEVSRLIDELRAGRMNLLAMLLKHFRNRMLGEPGDFDVGMLATQFLRDRKISLRVPEPNRRRDEERALTR